jgi:hypothetical protein
MATSFLRRVLVKKIYIKIVHVIPSLVSQRYCATYDRIVNVFSDLNNLSTKSVNFKFLKKGYRVKII